LGEFSGVVEGGGNAGNVPKYFLGNVVSSNDITTRGNSDTVAFPQVGLQSNMVS